MLKFCASKSIVEFIRLDLLTTRIAATSKQIKLQQKMCSVCAQNIRRRLFAAVARLHFARISGNFYERRHHLARGWLDFAWRRREAQRALRVFGPKFNAVDKRNVERGDKIYRRAGSRVWNLQF